jgi:hypothetical protein
MKNFPPAFGICLLSSLSFVGLSPVWGQAVSRPPEGVELRPVVSVDPVQPAPPTYELALSWSEKSSELLSVPIRNESAKPLKVLGAQATGGVFIGEYSALIEPGQQGSISFFYQGAADTDEQTAIIRLLTDQGIKVIRINLLRQEVVQVDTRELHWIAGDKTDEKIVTLTVAAGTVMPLKARTSGGRVRLEAVDATTWRLHIAPASTEHSGQFPVFVDFSPALPGKAVVILGVVQPQE